MTAEEMIYNAANAEYNEGLRLAKLHDLSGAQVALSRALRYNKRHTDARNLLGLVYFEFGEQVLALREWVISKNYQEKDNEADYYLKEVQRAGTLEKLDSAATKFNLGLDYARQGNLELARIQLKRVLSINPKMVRGRILLALILMETGKYTEARKELRYASKVDVNNITIAAYMQEVEKKIVEQEKKKKKKKKNQPDIMDLSDGNDNWNTTRQPFVEALDNTKSGILNLVIGTGIGVLVAIFLIVPTVKQSATNDAATALVSANAKAQTSRSDIESLSKKVSKLQSRLDKYEGQADVKQSYELLVSARTAYDAEELDKAQERLDSVTTKLLDKEGKTMYSNMQVQILDEQKALHYEEGMNAKKRGDFVSAIEHLKFVVKADPLYADGEAIFRLAESYEKDGKVDRAVTYYKKVAETYPGRYIGRRSKQKVDALGPDEEEEETTTEDLIEPDTDTSEFSLDDDE